MVQSANERRGDDDLNGLDRPRDRRMRVQGYVWHGRRPNK